MEDQIKGGRADKLTPEDIARKHSQFIGTIENEIELGTKIEMEHTNSKSKAREIAMDHVSEFYDYYSGGNGLINMEKKLANESITKKFRKLIKEYVDLDIIDETPIDITYNIKADGHDAGQIVVKIIDLNGSPAIEILKISLNDKFKSIKVIQDAISGLWSSNERVNKMIVSPSGNVVNMNFSGANWEKIYFERLNDEYLIRLRGH